jgi:Rod binding domain-containing protein
MSSVVGRHAAGEARRLQSVAQDFEALLLAELLKGLRRTVPQSNDRSHSGQMCLELLDEQLAVSIARQGGIGLAGILRAYLERAGDGSSGIDRNLSRASPDKR